MIQYTERQTWCQFNYGVGIDSQFKFQYWNWLFKKWNWNWEILNWNWEILNWHFLQKKLIHKFIYLFTTLNLTCGVANILEPITSHLFSDYNTKYSYSKLLYYLSYFEDSATVGHIRPNSLENVACFITWHESVLYIHPPASYDLTYFGYKTNSGQWGPSGEDNHWWGNVSLLHPSQISSH